MQKQHWTIVIGLFILVAVASTLPSLKGSQPDCNAILNPIIMNADFQTIQLKNAPDWAINKFSTSEKSIEAFPGNIPGETVVQIFGYRGEVGSKYLMYFENEDLVAINEGNRGGFYSIDAFKCLGEPEFYDAYYGNSWGAAYLWYPDQGIMTEYFVAWNKDVFKESPPVFNGKNLANIFYYQTPDLEYIATVVRSESMTNSNPYELNPWPGNWDQIEFIKIEE